MKRKHPHKRWDGDDATLIKMFEDGHSDAEIGVVLGRTANAIGHVAEVGNA